MAHLLQVPSLSGEGRHCASPSARQSCPSVHAGLHADPARSSPVSSGSHQASDPPFSGYHSTRSSFFSLQLHSPLHGSGPKIQGTPHISPSSLTQRSLPCLWPRSPLGLERTLWRPFSTVAFILFCFFKVEVEIKKKKKLWENVKARNNNSW